MLSPLQVIVVMVTSCHNDGIADVVGDLKSNISSTSSKVEFKVLYAGSTREIPQGVAFDGSFYRGVRTMQAPDRRCSTRPPR